MMMVELYQDCSYGGFEEVYRTYTLVCFQEEEMWVGEIRKQGQRVGYCESTDPANLSLQLRRLVDQYIVQAIRLRPYNEPDLKDWFKAISEALYGANNHEKDLLYALSRTKQTSISMKQLTKLAYVSSVPDTLHILSSFVRKVCDAIPFEPSRHDEPEDPYLALAFEMSSTGKSIRLKPLFSTIIKGYWP